MPIQGGTSYKSVLPPSKHSEMLRFLKTISGVYTQAKAYGVDKPDIGAFMDAYRFDNVGFENRGRNSNGGHRMKGGVRCQI